MPIHSLIEADRKHLIHPVINYRAHEARGVTVLESASGAFLRDAMKHKWFGQTAISVERAAAS